MASAATLRILIDTNIFIAAESDPDSLHPNAVMATELYRAATELGHTLCVGAGIRDDFARHADEQHKRRRRQQLTRYHVLRPINVPDGFQARAGYPPQISAQSHVDLTLLLALDRGAVQWLVTEDQRILPHAKALGLEDRVFGLVDALDVLSRQRHRPISIPTVETVAGYEINRDDPIFNDFAAEYGVRTWLRDKVAKEARPCLIMGGLGAGLDAIVILKEEFDDTWGLPGRVLKICTFKVATEARGVKRGELLLWAVFEYARTNGFDSIFVEAFEQEIAVVQLFESFGFSKIGVTHRTGEAVLGKRLHPVPGSAPVDPLAYHIRHGPGAIQPDRVFLVPILPRWHASLFPIADESHQLTLYEGMSDQGNAIRKAYVCHSGSRQLRGGDTLLFLRTREAQMVNVVGVVEETLRSSDPTQILAFTGRRTVYTPTEIHEMCSRREVLAIRFRLDRVLDTPIDSVELIQQRVMARSPQSIQLVRDGGALSWITNLLTG
ncbi:GNAT family N-acetyltransferase [Mycobacterium sp. 2YAF39]|uniref:GNAT family N-acetyltransferase n=1 Tax=Mycobacterium sp. 2YAF39 TaxID=3233033 RepID=UPI003F9554BE